jgi:hypothetical protein
MPIHGGQPSPQNVRPGNTNNDIRLRVRGKSWKNIFSQPGKIRKNSPRGDIGREKMGWATRKLFF